MAPELGRVAVGAPADLIALPPAGSDAETLLAARAAIPGAGDGGGGGAAGGAAFRVGRRSRSDDRAGRRADPRAARPARAASIASPRAPAGLSVSGAGAAVLAAAQLCCSASWPTGRAPQVQPPPASPAGARGLRALGGELRRRRAQPVHVASSSGRSWICCRTSAGRSCSISAAAPAAIRRSCARAARPRRSAWTSRRTCCGQAVARHDRRRPRRSRVAAVPLGRGGRRHLRPRGRAPATAFEARSPRWAACWSRGGTLLYSDFHPTAHRAGRRRLFERRRPRIRRRAPSSIIYPAHEAACGPPTWTSMP